VACRWELGHVRTGLGDEHIGHADRDSRDGHHQVPGALKRGDHHLNAGRQLVDGPGVLVDEVQVDLDQERVVLAEAPRQGLGQLGDLRTHPSLGQISPLGRVPLPGDQRLEHGPTRHAGDV
jgi:hypothetical protein